MENASKALIIAGAILLAIVIISLGLIVVNNVRNTVDTANLSEQEIQAFNTKFTSFEGSHISGSRVNSLIQQVIATNKQIADNGGNYFVAISFPTVTATAANWNSGYVTVASMDGTVNMTDRKPQPPTSAVGDDKANNKSGTIVEMRNFLRVNNGGGNAKQYAASVDQKATYKVTLTYYSGMVAGIVVEKE